MRMPSEQRVVITGAGSGLGRAFSLALAKRGARLILGDIDEAAVRETARLAREAGAKTATASQADVTRVEDVEALASAAETAFGGTDLVINNAGVAVAGAVGDVALTDWRWVVDVNMWGVIHGCHVFAPRLKQQGSGHILNVASSAGLLSAPLMGPYNVTKAAVIALSETLRAELAKSGVGVTVLCPTFFPTNIHRNARSMTEGQTKLLEKLFERTKWTAAGVAENALRAVEKNQLYVVPMADGRWMWRIKRAAPEGYGALMKLSVRLGLVERIANGK